MGEAQWGQRVQWGPRRPGQRRVRGSCTCGRDKWDRTRSRTGQQEVLGAGSGSVAEVAQEARVGVGPWGAGGSRPCLGGVPPCVGPQQRGGSGRCGWQTLKGLATQAWVPQRKRVMVQRVKAMVPSQGWGCEVEASTPGKAVAVLGALAGCVVFRPGVCCARLPSRRAGQARAAHRSRAALLAVLGSMVPPLSHSAKGPPAHPPAREPPPAAAPGIRLPRVPLLGPLPDFFEWWKREHEQGRRVIFHAIHHRSPGAHTPRLGSLCLPINDILF